VSTPVTTFEKSGKGKKNGRKKTFLMIGRQHDFMGAFLAAHKKRERSFGLCVGKTMTRNGTTRVSFDGKKRKLRSLENLRS